MYSDENVGPLDPTGSKRIITKQKYVYKQIQTLLMAQDTLALDTKDQNYYQNKFQMCNFYSYQKK